MNFIDRRFIVEGVNWYPSLFVGFNYPTMINIAFAFDV